VTEQAFPSDQIWNVTTDGARIQFFSTGNRGGKMPFSFDCDSADAASRAVALFPSASDPDCDELEQYHANLIALEARNPWASVTNLIIAANILVFVVMGCLGAGWIDSTRSSDRVFVPFVSMAALFLDSAVLS
jgi:hypothetical protein